MALLGEIFGSTVRREMKRRVDQVLKAGEEWNKTAKELTETLKELTKAIYEGNVDPKTLKPLGAPIRNLAKQSAKIAKAFTNYEKTLLKLTEKYG